MRTTVIIEDTLFRKAKKQAAEMGITVSDVVNRALREAFTQPKSAGSLPPFRMVTFGRDQPKVDHSPSELARATEDEDRETLRGS